ncbi:MAG: hypothetical protein R3330_04815, partial [Saprospiraceae bacterium]|nr:hypothetical protein [Saprospiraceae bacterium]
TVVMTIPDGSSGQLVRVMNTTGQTMDVRVLNGQQQVLELDVTHLPPGVYVASCNGHTARFLKT